MVETKNISYQEGVIFMTNLLERFISYVKIDTMSEEDSDHVPSTSKQFDLANKLKDDLISLGIDDVKVDNHCFVTGVLKTNTESDLKIGFMAHMDTIPGVSGTNVNPNIISDYDGLKIQLNENKIMDPADFPILKKYEGSTLITTDGTTVLGGDDKAGVAEIMTMLEFFVQNPDIPHVTIKVAFSPDEEVGGAMSLFDVEAFDCDFAYTVDGDEWNVINYENFNASYATVEVKGVDIHPGTAKDKMKNALLIAMEYNSYLPTDQVPSKTEGYEGFYHLIEMKGDVGSATMKYALRNHDLFKLEKQEDMMEEICAKINSKYGISTANINIKRTYYNMADKISKDMRCVDRAKNAIKKLGFEPIIEPIRGGTDGARLSQMGLLTPNLGTGTYNHHGEYEFGVLEEMELIVQLLIEIAKV